MSVARKASVHTTPPLTSIPWDVTEVALEAPWVLRVSFTDGTEGLVRVEKSHLTGVFEPLHNLSFFEQVYVEDGAVAWPGEIDLAPDAMYDAIKEHGEWVLS